MMSEENPSNPKNGELTEDAEDPDTERILVQALIRLKKRNRETLKALKNTHSSALKQRDKILLKLADEVQGALVTPAPLRQLAQFQVLHNDLSRLKWDKGEDLDRLETTLEKLERENGNNLIVEIFRQHFYFRLQLVKMHNYYVTHNRELQQKLLDYAKQIRRPLPQGAPPRAEKGG